MTAANIPGSLGRLPFGAGATIDSQLYSPRNGSTTITLTAVPTQPGTVQPFVRLRSGDQPLVATPVAVTANELALIQLNYALSGLGSVFVRYANTNATAGACDFGATDGGGR